jgi:hypothetical protein
MNSPKSRLFQSFEGEMFLHNSPKLMMPPQKKSKKNTPTEANQEDHHIAEDNGNFLTTEALQILD